MNSAAEKISDPKRFENTPAGWAKRWKVEVDAAKDSLKEWQDDGREVVRRFLDRRSNDDKKHAKVNLFPSNTQTTRAFLYGKVPLVDVKRRWGDPNDKAGRATGEALQRLLNTDLDRDSDSFLRALKYALSDRLLPGLGWVRLRYVVNTKTKKVDPKYKTDSIGNQILLAAGYETEEKSYEDVEVDYVPWTDVLWSAGARIWEEVRWVAFKVPLTREGLYDRFIDIFIRVYGGDPKTEPEDGEIRRKAKARLDGVPLDSSTNKPEGNYDALVKPDPWGRADVWEIWDKEHKKVWWWVDGFDEILDDKPDPLGLAGFWPCPMPMMANLTTDAFIPRSDYMLAQDLYNEVNNVTNRITKLEQAIIVRGVYNGNMKAVARLLNEAAENELIAIDDWPSFTEKGGLEGNIIWMPIEHLVEALNVLRDYRKELIALSQQVTGMSDILRGEASDRATATEQAIKAKFASIRLQDFQDEFARFASDVQRIKAEIISKFYDDKTIVERSNILYTADAPLVPQVLKLVRDRLLWYKIQIKPESISQTDYAAMQQERTQVMGALTQFLQTLVPIGEKAPELIPELLQVAGWMFASFRGGSTVEGIFDQLVKKAEGLAQAAMKQRMQPPQPGPKEQAAIQTAQVKAGAEIGKAKLSVVQAQQEHAQKVQQMHMENQQTVLEHGASMAKVEADIRKTGMEIAEKMVPEGAAAKKE